MWQSRHRMPTATIAIQQQMQNVDEFLQPLRALNIKLGHLIASLKLTTEPISKRQTPKHFHMSGG